MKHGIYTLDDIPLEGKTVLCRADMNSPIDRERGVLKDTTRIRFCILTIEEMAGKGAKVVLMAHQGGDLEYQSFASTEPHAKVLSELMGRAVEFIDDVCGPAARERIRSLKNGEILLLDNVRFMSEEMTLFETKLKLTPEQQAKTVVVRKLAPLADYYVCDAFAAVHRSQPSLVGFEEVLPSAMGRLFERELSALTQVRRTPKRPCIYVLGGAKIQDAFLMMGSVLADEAADKVLTCGLVANIMLVARGINIGKPARSFLYTCNLDDYVKVAGEILGRFGDRVVLPVDLACVDETGRREIKVDELPADALLVDIGHDTVEQYLKEIAQARTIFVNGPAGIFEKTESEYGTRSLLQAVARSGAFSVIGGGDSISAANKYNLAEDFSYVSTAGGGLVRFLSGEELPVVRALRRSADRFRMAATTL